MRMYIKRKQYKDHVRQQTLAGLISTPEGNWVQISSAVTDKTRRFVLEGTRGGGGKR